MSKFGKRSGSIADLKKKLEESSGNKTFIRPIHKDGVTVRFLEEIDQWYGYREHYDVGLRRYYPCVDESTCAGCLDPSVNRSMRYLTNALNVNTDSVLALKIPVSLMNRLVTRYEKYGTIIDRDYDLMRSGTGLKTEYDLSAEAPSAMKLDKYELHDLEGLLEDSWNEVFGDDSEDVLDSNPLSRSKDKDKDKDDSDDDESLFDDGYTQNELKKLTVGKLRSIAREMELGFDRTATKAELVEIIWEESNYE